jgi:hypothetical protein
MNPDDYIYKKRDWLKELYTDEYDGYKSKYLEHKLGKENYYDAWMEDEHVLRPEVPKPARFGTGDLLNAGGIVALVVSVIDGLNGWKYSVMRDGELMHVDEVALNEWSAI